MKRSLCLLGSALVLSFCAGSASAAFAYADGNTLGVINALNAAGSNTVFFANSIGGPAGIAFDSSGNLFVPNANANTIARIATNGVTTMFAIDPGDGSILSNPQDVIFDAAGNLYVADAFTDQIEKFTPGGVASVFAVDPGDFSILSSPSSLVFDAVGNLYVANDDGFGTDFIEKFSTNGAATRFATDPGNGSVLNSPSALTFDNSGNLYAANQGQPAFIEKFTSGGTPSTFVNSGLTFPTGLATDASGNIYAVNNTNLIGHSTVTKYQTNGAGSIVVSNLYSPTAIRFDKSGDIVVADYTQVDIIPTNGGLTSNVLAIGVGASGLALDTSSNLYVAGFLYGNTISKITPAGAGTVWANLNTPVYAVVLDGAGNGYATLSYANQIAKIAANGATSIFATDPGTGNVLNFPQGIAIDGGGNLFVVNLNTNNIVKFTPAGTPSTFASTGANFGYGPGIAIDKSNNVYTEYNSSILKFAPNGSSTTFATDPGDNSVLDGPIGMAFDGAGNLYVVNNGGFVEKFSTNGAPSRFSDSTGPGGSFITLMPYVAGLPLPPLLHIAQSGTNAVLSWAVSSGNFYLQSTPGLSPTNWTTLSNITPSVVGTNYVETNGVGAASKFFRLISQ